MIKIRLRSTGRKRINTFRIVVINVKSPRDSLSSIADIGYYHPQFKIYLKFDIQKYNYWIKNGAQATERVTKLFNIANNIYNQKQQDNLIKDNNYTIIVDKK